MIKKFLVSTFFILIFLSSCAPRIIRNAHKGEKSDFGLTSPSKAVFFVKNEKIESTDQQVLLHTQTADKIYNQFGFATDALMIGRTNAKTFKFSTGKKSWFVEVKNLKNRTAMVLFDGLSKPIIAYDPEQYNVLVIQYLGDDLKKAQNARKNKVTTKKNTALILDSIWTIPFSPDKNYAEKIINLSQTNYYPGLFKGKCHGEIQTTNYTDAFQKEVSSSYSTTYDKGRILKSSYSIDGNRFQQEYFVNGLGLIDSTVSTLNTKIQNTVYFKYLPDRYITRDASGYDRDEYLLNEKYQVYKKVNFDENNETSSEQRYFYDQLGRLIREENYSSGKKTLTSFYEYNDQEQLFSKMNVFDASEKLLSESFNIKGKLKNIFITKVNDQIHSKNVSEVDETCQGKIIIYNKDNQATMIMVQERK